MSILDSSRLSETHFGHHWFNQSSFGKVFIIISGQQDLLLPWQLIEIAAFLCVVNKIARALSDLGANTSLAFPRNSTITRADTTSLIF